MIHNNNDNEFEHFLRNSIEDYIMIPQRKVWYGIYNHLHPEKKWPSIAACFCILVSIMHLGISNNKNINTDIQLAKNNSLHIQNIYTDNLKQDNTTASHSNTAIINSRNIVKLSEQISATNNNDVEITTTSNKKVAISKPTNAFTFAKAKINITTEQPEINSEAIAQTKESVENISLTEEKNNATEIVKETTTIKNNELVNKKIEQTNTAEKSNNYSTLSSLIKLPKKSKRSEIAYYITPSVGYRILEQRNNTKLANSFSTSNNAAITNSYGTNNEIEDKKAMNIEIGAVGVKTVNNKLKVFSGVQLNYTNYISRATSLDHPTQNVLATRSFSSQYRSMDFSSTPGEVNLNKTTLQISMPIGFDYNLLGDDKLSWKLGASIQPSIVIAGSGYVFSADTKYYVSEKELLNRINASASIESFLSIKTASGIRLNVGPQVRYQLFSTYKKNYNFKENLYNFGLKIGVSTSL